MKETGWVFQYCDTCGQPAEIKKLCGEKCMGWKPIEINKQTSHRERGETGKHYSDVEGHSTETEGGYGLSRK